MGLSSKTKAALKRLEAQAVTQSPEQNARDWRMLIKGLLEYRAKLERESTFLEVARLTMFIEEMRDVSRR